ncbi:MAG: hypothetical protein OXH51_02120 [Gemmatimonadetes bacterium]|nr:hypothetical protein [Gemmatimonadota bacterium]MCY3679696.1 hypothetical protein [Gemmatimonadota bacterium]MYE94745.1 hypothetical protein [Gemmatimonadota bacterium]
MMGRREGVEPAGAVEQALAWRARAALEAERGETHGADVTPAPGLLDSLRNHLLAGETHYPDRPGMVELRRQVGAALPDIGYPRRDPDGVLITASEGESLFVTLLGLGAGKGTRFTGSAPGRHQALFDWIGLARAESGAAGSLHYRDTGKTGAQADSRLDRSVPIVHNVGGFLFGSEGWTLQGDLPADLIVIGSLDGLDGMLPFRLGFVAAPPEILAAITRWKQASSICSPAPSQRAALWALGARP